MTEKTDHPYTDKTGAMTENRDWESGEGQHLNNDIYLPNSSHLVCTYPGCKSSGRVFNRSYELERHKLIHSPSKKLVCPIQGCKHKKKGKSFTRNDKFREHIATHGELALVLCPISHCKIVQVKKCDLASHIADDHNILERYEIGPLLDLLRINFGKGRWACPLLCDVTAIDWLDLARHFFRHDLVERVNSASIFHGRITLRAGRVTCPICNLEVCDKDGRIEEFFNHLENLHADCDFIASGNIVAKLLCLVWVSKFDKKYPRLARTMRDCKSAQAGPSTLVPTITWPSSEKASSGSSDFPSDLGDVLSVPEFDGEAAAKDPLSARVGEINTQHVWAPHCNDSELSVFFPEADMADFYLPVGDLSTSHQEMIFHQDLVPMPDFLQPYGIIPQQSYLHPYIQPQGFTVPRSFITVGSPQNVLMASTIIPQLIPPGIPAWQPPTNAPINRGFGQYGYSGHMQWPLQPEIGYGCVNQQQDVASLE